MLEAIFGSFDLPTAIFFTAVGLLAGTLLARIRPMK